MKHRGLAFLGTILLAASVLATASCGQAPAPATKPVPTAAPAQKGTAAGAPTTAPAEKAAATSAPSKPTPAAPPRAVEKVSMAIPAKSFAQLPLYAGVAGGVYAAEGLDVKISVVKSDAAVAALSSGELDYTTAGSSVIQSAAQGVPVRLVAGGADKAAFYLMVRPEYNSLKDLKGKAIGVTVLSSATGKIMDDLLAGAGLDPKQDVQKLALGETGAILAALTAGQIAGGLLSPPWELLAEQQGFKKLLFAGDYVKVLLGGLGVSEQKLEQNPDQVERMIRATIKGIRYTQDPANRDAVVAVIMKEFELDQPAARAALAGNIKLWRPDGSVDDDVLNAEMTFWKQMSGFEGDISLSRVIDFTILKKVQKEFGS